MTEKNYNNRFSKLDSFFLWIASLSGIGFSIFISYLKLPFLLYVPIFILIGYAVAIGYLKGAVFSESLTERMRGWNYLIVGLSVYVPLTILKLSESNIQARIANYLTWEPLLSISIGLLTVLSYIIISQKRTTPGIYRSFGENYGVVSKTIIRRTIYASLFLGFTLYIAILAPIGINYYSLAIYVALILLFAEPIVLQEQRIGKLLLLKKFQNHVDIEKFEKNLFQNVFFTVFVGIAVVLQLIQLLPRNELQATLTLSFSIALIVSIFALFLSMVHSDRGDLVSLKETAEIELQEEELSELKIAVNKVNGLCI